MLFVKCIDRLLTKKPTFTKIQDGGRFKMAATAILSECQTNDKNRPILSAHFLGEIWTSSTAEFITEISADKIQR